MTTFTVPKKIESLNSFVRGNWRKHHRYKQAWFLTLWAERNPPKMAPEKKIKVTVTSYRTKLLDRDNLIGGCKAILDALVKLKYLKDDSPEWVQTTYMQIVDRNEQRTVIEIC